MRYLVTALLTCGLFVGSLQADTAAQLAKLPVQIKEQAGEDWLIDSSRYKAKAYTDSEKKEITLSNGLVSRTFRITPNAATVRFDNLVTGQAMLRGVKPEAIVIIDNKRYEVGGLNGQPNYAFLTPEWLDGLTADPKAFQFSGLKLGVPNERFGWKRVRHHAPDVVWPPKGIYLRMDYAMPQEAEVLKSQKTGVVVSVHYELYDGVPVMSKWITVQNATDKQITVDRFSSEMLALVEHNSWVGAQEGVAMIPPGYLHVETDMAFGSGNHENACVNTVRWRSDPQYSTQVNYRRVQPCLLSRSQNV